VVPYTETFRVGHIGWRNSYGYFQGKDLIRVGLVLTIVEGLILFIWVPFYWPLIGLQWVK
jgi:hypothetical protein